MKKFRSFVFVVAFCVVPGVFGMHGGEQLPNNDRIVNKAKRILKDIRTIDQNVENIGTKPVVLLGATGSGKTSLLHVLAGTEMKVVESDGLVRRFSLVPSADAVGAIGRVDGGGRSVTSDIRPFKIGDVIYCDGPGFFDTHGGLTEMGNNLIMNKVLSRGAKILWVVSVNELVAMRGEAAAGSLRYLQSLLPWNRSMGAEQKAMNIGIVISKGREARSSEDAAGLLGDALNMLMDRDNHHWLIDYLSEHTADNAFLFPSPATEGVYHAPDGLINGIKSFATRQSGELITGSMGLRPEVISDLVENHVCFDVKKEVDNIASLVSIKLKKYEDDLNGLRGLEKIFNKLWNSLAVRSLHQEISDSSEEMSDDSEEMSDSSQEMLGNFSDRGSLVKQWRKQGSSSDTPWKTSNFKLRDFVDVLDDIEYFKILCDVEDDGFFPKFERGIVWEDLVDYISTLSNTSENEIKRLRSVGDSWKKKLPRLMRRSNKVSKKIKESHKNQTEKLVVGTASATAGVIGAVAGGIIGKGSVATTVGGVSGAMVGATIAKSAMKVTDFVQTVERNLSKQKLS